jgi:ribosomal protein S17E
VRTKTVKKASRVLVEKYYSKLTLDFDTNKRVAEDVAVIQTKRLRNKIAGFTTVRSCKSYCMMFQVFSVRRSRVLLVSDCQVWEDCSDSVSAACSIS